MELHLLCCFVAACGLVYGVLTLLEWALLLCVLICDWWDRLTRRDDE